MEMSARADTLRNLLKQDPANSFLRYGLAMDCVSNGRLEDAMAEFRTLIAQDPEYCAAYFHGGQTLEKLGQNGEAADLYREGIVRATRAGDDHTRSELQAALDMIG